MARKPTPKSIETAVLVRSRRRCCICFGLDRDTQLKVGQIAHLDRDNANHAESNLAFLCFRYHDEYDSTSSQRKNFTIGEVKEFREELYRSINKAFTQRVHFGEITTPPTDPYAGSWIRIGTGNNSAELKLTPLPDGYESKAKYYVSGLALWGTERPGGPNIGVLEFIGNMADDDTISYRRPNGRIALTVLAFNDDTTLIVTEDNCLGEYGFNVTFEGTYQRAS